MKIIKMIFFIVIFSGAMTKADILTEGKKKISYSFEVTNIDSFPSYTFLAYPVNQSNSVPFIKQKS